MKRLRIAALFVCLPAGLLLAQPKIGGGACTSASLSGVYAVSITGRQVTSAGTFTNVIQTNGSASFDGLSKVVLTLTADTLSSVGTAQTWSGTYSIQANCAGTVTIASGGQATFSLVVYNQGAAFLVTGSDATYSYSGSGNNQPAACSTSLLSGSYAFTSTGFAFSGSAISAVGDATGVLQFDGKGNVTVDLFQSTNGTPNSEATASGTYSVSSNCLGTANLTDTKGNAFGMSLSLSGGNTTATTDLFVTLARASKEILAGSAHTVATETCSAASLTGAYALTMTGRAVSSSGTFAGGFQSDGTATFDGQGKVTLTGTSNTNLAAGKSFTYTGAYTVSSNCLGSVTITTASPATFALMVWNTGKQFNMTGSDATYVYSASGFNVRPAACGTATLSGLYVYDASGFTLSGTTQNGVADESGVFQFDGQGNMTAAYSVTSSGSPASSTATGTYTVGSNCLGSATLTDSSGKSNTATFSIQNVYGQGVDVIEASSQFVRSGGAHAAFVNPTQSIGNAGSYGVNATPAGSVFSLFGENLAVRPASATAVPLPTTLGSTSVTVNGELAPLFYADSGQINAQLPWDIPPGALATVIVKNGSSTSNAAALYVPATGTPGIIVYGSNRAVVVNQDGSVNSATAGAAVGDQVVAYFIGGGPVQAAGKLVTGAPAPDGLSPVTGNATVTVGTQPAAVKYIGLTPQSIGLYQVNFVVPQLAKGTYPLVINIAGQASNNPVITISN